MTPGTYLKRKRLAILTNIVTPYRAPLYRLLAERFDTIVLLSGREDNRTWEQSTVPNVVTKVSRGFTVKSKSLTAGGAVAEQKYLHINPGYATDLVRFRPEAIISAEMGFRSLIALLYGALFRTPVWILWAGGLHTNRIHGQSLFRRFMRRHLFAKLARHWICLGKSSSEYLQWLGVPRERILQVQNPANDAPFNDSASLYEIKGPRPRALFVGRLIVNKGLSQLLEATARLHLKGHRFSLVVVGDGPEGEFFRGEAERLGVGCIEWISNVVPDEMPSVYRACDFLIFPTLDDVWGQVVNEAILSGIPVVASRYAGCAEELLPPENVFDPLDPDSLIDAYERALVGEIAPPSATWLQPMSEIADLIADDINRNF